jgi:hypothetical protein
MKTMFYSAVVVFLAGQCGNPLQAGELCLLKDPHFQSGAVLYGPQEGSAHVPTGHLMGLKRDDKPIWGVSQWNTKTPFQGEPTDADPRPKVIDYQSGSKDIRFGSADSAFADVSLRLDSSEEYIGGLRPKQQRWPALYLWQQIEEGPSFEKLQAVHFSMEARLMSSKNLHPPQGRDDKSNAAQFTVFITLQNFNKQSPDFGKYVWFGVPIYDNRFEFSPHHEQQDAATHKLIYLVDDRLVTKDRIQNGQWAHFEGDLANEMKQSVKAAITTGNLSHTNLSDVFIRSLNVGWEIPGTFDADMQIRNLSVCVE